MPMTSIGPVLHTVIPVDLAGLEPSVPSLASLLTHKEDTVMSQTAIRHLSLVGTESEPDAIPQQPEKIRAEVQRLSRQHAETEVRLGKLLKVVRDRELYLQWGYETWEKYVSEEVKIHIETARTALRVERELIEKSGFTEEEISEIGITKANILTKAVPAGKLTPENKSEYIEMAKATASEPLRQRVQQIVSESPIPVPSLMPITFYLTNEQQETINRARELASQLTNSQDPGQQLTSIAQEYLGTVSEDDAKAPEIYRVRRLMWLVKMIEETYGLTVGFTPQTKDGESLLKAFKKDVVDPVI